MNKYDKVMKKVNKFYNNPKEEECYALDASIIAFLLPRLKRLINDSSSTIDWNSHTKTTGVDVIKSINSIIKDLEYIDYNLFQSEESISKELTDECMKRSKRAFKKLGEIFFHLGW